MARIMVVEDEQIIAVDLTVILRKLAHEVVGVEATGEGAVERAGRERPDLVLMDIVLKGLLDGIEAAAEIRSLFDIPVIFMTSLSDDGTLRRVRGEMPAGYLIKPVEENELLSSIEGALETAV